MQIETPRYAEGFGSVRLNGLQRVLELDSGRACTSNVIGVHKIKRGEMDKIMRRLVIVVPIKNERLKLIEGVFSGIPHDCFLIVISNSQRKPSDSDCHLSFTLSIRSEHFLQSSDLRAS